MDTKSWYLSKTIWGAILMIIGLVLNQLGYTLTAEDQATLVDVVVALASGVGAILTIYGRIKASKQIT